MLKRPCDESAESGGKAKKPRREGQLIPDDGVEESTTSDETWSPSSENESSEEDEAEEGTVKEPVAVTRVLRSGGAVVRPGDEMHAIMDKIDEVIDNESDFSSTTDEEEEEDEESDDGEEEEEDESDTEEDGYSDDDSFVTSCDEDEAEIDSDDEEEEEAGQTAPETKAEERILDPVTTDELLAEFGDAAPPPEEPTLSTSAEE